MKQWQAIQAVTQELRQRPSSRALWPRIRGDECSDVDLYCLVEEAALAGFLPQRLGILEATGL